MKKNELLFMSICGLCLLGTIGAAVVLACKGIDGWGWFLVVAVLILIGTSYDSDSDKTKKNE